MTPLFQLYYFFMLFIIVVIIAAMEVVELPMLRISANDDLRSCLRLIGTKISAPGSIFGYFLKNKHTFFVVATFPFM